MGSLWPHCMIKKHFALAVGTERQDTLGHSGVRMSRKLHTWFFTQRQFDEVFPLDISRKKMSCLT